MNQRDLLLRVANAFERHRIPYLVTGSVATMFYGEPRLTRDIDVVARLAPGEVASLLAEFPRPEFYSDVEAAREAVRRHGQFSIVHPTSGWKVDVMVAAMDAFDRSRFARARRVDADGVEAFFTSAEDAIVKKLVFVRAGGTDRHLRDIASVLAISGAAIERAYVSEWAAHFGVVDLWHLVLDELERRSHPV